MKQKAPPYVLIAVTLVAIGIGIFMTKGAPARDSLAGVALPTIGGQPPLDLGACATPKCLTVYVAPWCGICRASTPLISKLVAWLAERGVVARIVVGRDQEGEIASYAREFGDGAFVDMRSEFPLRGGVPSFVVSDGTGKILKVVPGVPRIYTEPIRDEYLAEVSKFLGLI